MSKDTAEMLLVFSVVILGLGIAYMLGNFFMGIELRKETFMIFENHQRG